MMAGGRKRRYRDDEPQGGLNVRNLAAMAIYDRKYYRDNSTNPLANGFPIRSCNTWLIVINVAIFIVQAITMRTVQTPSGPVTEGFGQWLYHAGYFSSDTLLHRLEFWRLISFQFLHSGVLHIALNMLGLYMFGRLVEQHLGPRRYLAFYIVCGIFGGVLYFLLNLGGVIAFKAFGTTGVPGLLFNDMNTPLVGASAGVFGVMMAAAFLEPKLEVIAFPIPIPMKLRTLVYVYLGLATVNLLFGRFLTWLPLINAYNAGGDAAHLGGALAGAFFIRRIHLLRDFFDVWNDSRKQRKAAKTERDEVARRLEIDRILDKVSTSGLHSLTDKERETLREETDLRRAG
jgi:membrane associated rhomboid family serine protease